MNLLGFENFDLCTKLVDLSLLRLDRFDEPCGHLSVIQGQIVLTTLGSTPSTLAKSKGAVVTSSVAREPVPAFQKSGRGTCKS
jgi:hypothetical protein